VKRDLEAGEPVLTVLTRWAELAIAAE
jgi:hypothetical protein